MAIITDDGLEYIAKNLNDVADVVFTFMGNGYGVAGEQASDSALVSENTLYGSARKAATCTYVAPGVAKFNALFAFTGHVVVREVGIFDAPTGGHLLYRRVLTANRTYEDGDAAEFTVMIEFARGV